MAKRRGRLLGTVKKPKSGHGAYVMKSGRVYEMKLKHGKKRKTKTKTKAKKYRFTAARCAALKKAQKAAAKARRRRH